MRPIPLKHRKIINTAPYFNKSCLTGKKAMMNDRIVIHHAWQYAKGQISEIWNYCPLLESEHSPYSKTPSTHNNKEIEEKVKLIAIEMAGVEYLKIKFPKKDWGQIYNYLHNKYKNDIL